MLDILHISRRGAERRANSRFSAWHLAKETVVLSQVVPEDGLSQVVPEGVLAQVVSEGGLAQVAQALGYHDVCPEHAEVRNQQIVSKTWKTTHLLHTGD